MLTIICIWSWMAFILIWYVMEPHPGAKDKEVCSAQPYNPHTVKSLVHSWHTDINSSTSTTLIHLILPLSNPFSLLLTYTHTYLSAGSRQRSSILLAHCRHKYTSSCDPKHHGVCPTGLQYGTSLLHWWYILLHGLKHTKKSRLQECRGYFCFSL